MDDTNKDDVMIPEETTGESMSVKPMMDPEMEAEGDMPAEVAPAEGEDEMAA